MFKHSTTLILLFLVSVSGRRGGGGGGGRGSSGARIGSSSGGGGGFGGSSGGSYSPNRGSGGGYPSSGNYHPQSGVGSAGGGYQPRPNNIGYSGNQGGFHGGSPSYSAGSFGRGTGPGSFSSGSSFKTALAGAAVGTIGGLLAFEAGKAIIHSASTPFNHNNNNYYWGQEYYPHQAGKRMCQVPFETLVNQNTAEPTTTTTVAPGTNASETTTGASVASTTPDPSTILSTIQFQNGTRPKQLVWSCRERDEVCCGVDCCHVDPPAGSGSSDNNNYLFLGIILLIALVVIGYCVYTKVIQKPASSTFSEPTVTYNTEQQPPYDPYKQNTYAMPGNPYPTGPYPPTYPHNQQPYESMMHQPPNYYVSRP